jgi:SAM-dependent methyltransferase
MLAGVDERLLHARSFGRAAEVYARARPSYPPDAVDFLLPAGVRRVLDLGAGTGKLTEALAARGLDVVAVEPVDQMRAQLAAALPSVTALAGAAEAVPLPDAALDAVVVGQAWHWFDQAAAVRECGRVLRPGGWLGLVWNTRDERVRWVRALGDVLRSTGDPVRPQDPSAVVAPFGPVETYETTWAHSVTVQSVLDLVASRSYVIVLPEARRAEILDEVRALLLTHPDVAGRESFSLPYVTTCFRARLSPLPPPP